MRPVHRSRLSISIASAAAVLAFACASRGPDAPPVHASAAASSAPAAASAATDAGHGHVGTHGMVLFGSERIFLSHIPMYTAPHDLQLLLEIEIPEGVPDGQRRFADGTFTVQPTAKWSLEDLAAGALRDFKGTIFSGNFEDGGKPIHRDARFVVKRVLFQRPMSASMPASQGLDYLAIGTPKESFLVHLIGAPPSFDQVVRVRATAATFLDAQALAAGTAVRASGRGADATARLSKAAAVSVARLGPTGQPASPPASLEVTTELSCLAGNDFSEACPPPAAR